MRITVFVVKENARNKGIGEILMRTAESWAAEHGLKTVLVNSGNRDERIAAHAFIKKWALVLNRQAL